MWHIHRTTHAPQRFQKMQSPFSGGCHIQPSPLCRSFDKPFYVNLCGNKMMQQHNSKLAEGSHCQKKSEIYLVGPLFYQVFGSTGAFLHHI